MARKIVTLYIDDTSLRLLVVRGRRIEKWAEVPLEPGLVKNNVVIQEAQVAARVRQLFRAKKIRTRKVILGLSGLHCLSRPITLPRLPKAMLNEAVTREAKRVLPVPLEQLYISWQTISAADGKIQIFLVAVPCRIADAVLRPLRQAGLKPYLMDLKPLALARVVKEPTAIIVDVQPTEFDIVIMADGVPQPVRTLPFPSRALSWQEKLSMITDEVSRTITFHNSSNPEKSLTTDATIFVSGEGAAEPELSRSLSDELGHPVLPLPSPLQYPEQLDPARYFANIGLALRELEAEARPLVADVNALPIPYRPEPISLVRIAVLPAAVIAIGTLALMTMRIQDTSANIASAGSQLSAANQLLSQKQLQRNELKANVAELESRVASVEASRDTFIAASAALDGRSTRMNGDLRRVVSSSLLRSITLTGVSHANGALTVRGRSPSETEILSYLRSLDASGRFSEITIAGISRIDGAGMDFTLVLRTKG